MTPKALRAFALSLPEACEAPHFERISFRVGKKIFATMTMDGKEAMVVVKPHARVEALLEDHPEAFFSHGGWTRLHGSLGVRLAKVPAAMMKELVVESWRRIAPGRALKAFAG